MIGQAARSEVRMSLASIVDEASWEKWEDPGEYPNGVASAPLPDKWELEWRGPSDILKGGTPSRSTPGTFQSSVPYRP